MKKRHLVALVIFATLTLAVFTSCKKDSNSANNTPSASIKDTSQTVNESAGTATVVVNLSSAATQALKFNFTLSGTAILNGDYETDSSSSITIQPGSTSATLKFTIYDDPVPEPGKTIQVTFSPAGNVTLSHTNAIITIQDNDASRASTGLETDLLWDAGSLVDLDLYVANNVVLDTTNNTITVKSLHVVDSSQNLKGFESVLIKNSDPDGDYYFVVAYADGSRAVNFNLISNGPNVSNSTFPDSFTAAEKGSAFFYGPIHKLGSTYSRQSGATFNLQQIKRYVYHGKMK